MGSESTKGGFTQGPWRFETVRTSCGLCHRIGPFPWRDGQPSNACIYVDYPGNGQAERELLANAHLIAAAPGMYEALAKMTALYVQLAGSGDCGFWNPEEEPGVIAARAALRLAEGANDGQ